MTAETKIRARPAAVTLTPAAEARVAELEGLLREAHAHLGDYCDDNEQAGFPAIAAMVAELLARIEAAVGVAGNKAEVPK